VPHYVVERVAHTLNERTGRGLRGAKVLVLGVAYKKNVEDTRESPALKLFELLEKRGAVVDFYDPHVERIPTTRQHPEFAGRVSITWDPAAIGRYDTVLIATDHDDVDYRTLSRHAKLIVDTRNACARAGVTSYNVIKS
jgi:UDP-N-acetyl-D-glucosamine dehydrogenase